MANKHFNAGNVYGKVTEVKEAQSEGDKDYLQITVDVSGSRSGSVRAFCRMWGEKRCREFLDEFRRGGEGKYWFKGFFSQYQNRDGLYLSNFTVYQWERKDSDSRAVFILKGEVSHQPSQTVDGGQRFLLRVFREGQGEYQDTEDSFEVWAPGEKLLDQVKLNDLVEIKGMVRQETVDDFYGGAEGPIRAYVDKLKICNPF